MGNTGKEAGPQGKHIKTFWAKTIMVLTGAHCKLLSRLA